MKNICIVGAGGREHAIAYKLSLDERVNQITLIGESGVQTDKIKSVNYPVDKLEHFLTDESIDLTIIGPEVYLSEGIVDRLSQLGHRVFGPTKKSAQLESSKSFSKEFMLKYDIPTAQYHRFESYEEALGSSGLYGYPEVIKADGLCGGKGVLICQNKEESQQALQDIFVDKIFKDQGSSVIIEQYLSGFEASLLCFVSNNKITPFDSSMDYKKIYEGDRGPNTGGVGVLSPNPHWTEDLTQQSNQILKKIEKGLEQEGLGYSGILFIGYLIEDNQIYVLEFNTRFGDPETEVLLPRLTSNLLDHFEDCIDQKPLSLTFSEKIACGVVLVSEGYPSAFDKGKEITGIDEVNALVFHNGTKRINGKLRSNGGRVLTVVALDESLNKAREKVYEELKKIIFENKSYRKDIGNIK